MKNEAFGEVAEAFKEAIYAVGATPEYKAKVEADKAKEEAGKAIEETWDAVAATPAYKTLDEEDDAYIEAWDAYIEAWDAYAEACKAEDKAWKAVKATSEYKRYVKALNALLCRRHDEEEFNV